MKLLKQDKEPKKNSMELFLRNTKIKKRQKGKK